MILFFPIQAYFDGDNRNDGDALIRTFAPDAVVKDEGRSHAGRQAIHAWWQNAKTKYQHAVEPLDVTGKGDLLRVRARVTGQFPGSPAMLTFAFLEIGA